MVSLASATAIVQQAAFSPAQVQQRMLRTCKANERSQPAFEAISNPSALPPWNPAKAGSENGTNDRGAVAAAGRYPQQA